MLDWMFKIMAVKEQTKVKVEIVISPVCDVLRALMAAGDASCGEDSPELGALRERLQQQLRPRLLANIERYFNRDCYPGMGLLSLIDEAYALEVPDFIQALSRMPLNDLAVTLLGFGRIYRGNLPPPGNIAELRADRGKLIEHIRANMSVSDEKIETLADIIMDPTRARDDLSELIEHFWYVILQPEAEKRARLQQEVADKCRERLSEIGPLRFVTGLTKLHLSEKGGLYEKYVLAPNSFEGDHITAIENKEETGLILSFNKDQPILKARREEPEDNTLLDKTRLANIFNSLGDKTRLEIVRALVERPHYGQELAKMLGISNATVFYHLSQLEKTEAIHLERIEHRVYYVLDIQRLSYLLNQASTFLLG
jgi:DNA-binding transcriptional ArsR family regulator